MWHPTCGAICCCPAGLTCSCSQRSAAVAAHACNSRAAAAACRGRIPCCCSSGWAVCCLLPQRQCWPAPLGYPACAAVRQPAATAAAAVAVEQEAANVWLPLKLLCSVPCVEVTIWVEGSPPHRLLLLLGRGGLVPCNLVVLVGAWHGWGCHGEMGLSALHHHRTHEDCRVDLNSSLALLRQLPDQ